MSRDHLTVIAIAGGWSAAIGLIGLVCVWFARRRSLRWVFVSVALVGVVGIVAGVGRLPEPCSSPNTTTRLCSGS